MIESISAVTLATHDMGRAVRFYRTLGFELLYGGVDAQFTSLRAGTGYLNLIAQPAERRWSWWGRVIFHVSDVDAVYARAVELGATGLRPPEDQFYGDRAAQIQDPFGHRWSLQAPIEDVSQAELERRAAEGGYTTEP